MAKGRWITPDETGDSNIARCLSIPEKLQPAANWALQQLTFPDNWEQVGTLTPAECAAAFVDVLSAYYESEGCTDMNAPDRQLVLWTEGVVSAGNAIAQFVDASQGLNTYWAQSAPAINDEVVFSVLLQAGTYDLTIVGQRQSASGIQHWIIDGAEDAQTIDMYNSGLTVNYTATISIVIASSGLHEIKCKISTKNGSSSNYQNRMTYFKLIRTGD